MAERFRLFAKAGLAALVLVLAGCGDTLENFDGPTMGSTYSVKYVRDALTPDIQTAKTTMEAILAGVDRQMSAYCGDFLISRFSALPTQSCMELPPPMLELLRYGGELSEQSQDVFDVTVGPLMGLRGFGSQARVEKIPSTEQIATARYDVGHRHLRIDGQHLCKDAVIQLDFDSIVAGYIVNMVDERLKEPSVRSYLAEITGGLKAGGHKPDGTPQRIAIETSHGGQWATQQVLALDGYGVPISDDYHNYFEKSGQRYSHTFDPCTGASIDHHLVSVTVIDLLTRNADGLSTLLMVFGPEEGYHFAEKHRLAALFVSRQSNGFDNRTTPRYEQLFGNRGERPWPDYWFSSSCCRWSSACPSGSSWAASRSSVPAAASPIWGSRRSVQSAAATGRNTRKPTAMNLQCPEDSPTT